MTGSIEGVDGVAEVDEAFPAWVLSRHWDDEEGHDVFCLLFIAGFLFFALCSVDGGVSVNTLISLLSGELDFSAVF